jgi:hypothetical protein
VPHSTPSRARPVFALATAGLATVIFLWAVAAGSYAAARWVDHTLEASVAAAEWL